MGRTARKPENTDPKLTDPEVTNPDIDPEDEDLGDLPWEEDLRQWDIEERQENEISRFVLYRRILGVKGGGKEKIWEWSDEIPGSHEIGIRFGGGRYAAYLILPKIPGDKKNRLRLRHFSLAETYTEEKKKADRLAAMNGDLMPTHQAQPQAPNQLELIAFIIEKVITPLMAGQRKAPDQFEQFRGFSDAMIEVTANAARSQISLVKELQKEMVTGRTAQQETDPENAPPGDTDFKDFLKDVLKEYGPTIIEAGALKMKAIAAGLKREEVFQTLKADQGLFSRVLSLLGKDPDLDLGMAQKVLNKLSRMDMGLKIPLGVLVTPANQNGSKPVE